MAKERPDTDVFLPIHVIIGVEGHENITIKIADAGSAIPRGAIPLIRTYMYTTKEN